MNKAVVSTGIGAEGIACKHGQDIMLADKPEDFAQTVLQLMDDQELSRSLGQKARELVLRQYDWKIIGKNIIEAYGKIIKNK